MRQLSLTRCFCFHWAHEQDPLTGHRVAPEAGSGRCLREGRYAREELVAELGAVLLGDRVFGDRQARSRAMPLLGHWIEMASRLADGAFFQVLREARQASGF